MNELTIILTILGYFCFGLLLGFTATELLVIFLLFLGVVSTACFIVGIP